MKIKMKTRVFFFIFLKLFSQNVFPFFVEMGIDLSPRSQFKKTISNTSFKYKSVVSNFSLHSGITREELSAGLAYSRSILNYRYRIYEPSNTGSTGNLLNRSHENLGFFIGYSLGGKYRFLGSYYFYSKLKAQSDDSGANPTSKGDTYQGVGLELEMNRRLGESTFVGIGWRRVSLNEFKDGPTGVRVGLPSGATSKGQTDSVFVKASFSLDFPQIL